MFNLLRLFRRDDTIDDTAAAYVEGRANEREQAELRDRAVREPGLFRDLDSIRDTVSLLRSVESVAAPRSFALSVAPVQVRVKRPRMAMAPAAFAIAAAAVVGLLAVGNLADVVRQNDDSSQTVASRNSAEDSVTAGEGLAQTESAANAGSSGPASDPAAPAIDSDSTEAIERSGTAPGTAATPPFSPLPTNVPANASLAPPADPAESVAGGPDVAGAQAPGIEDPPPVDGGAPDQGLSLVAPGEGVSEPGDLGGADIKAIEPGFEPGSSEPMPLPESTLTALFDPSGSLALESAEPLGGTVIQDDKSGFSLPLWQLQVVFATIAVLMAGAWMILQRRLTA